MGYDYKIKHKYVDNNRSKSPFFILLIAIFIGIAIFGAIIILRKPKDNSQNDVNSSQRNSQNEVITSPQTYTYTETYYFVPVTSHLNIQLNDLTFEKIKDDEILVLANEEEEIKSQFPDLKLQTQTDYETLVENLNTNPDKIGLVKFETLDFKLKTLRVNNIFLFDKNIALADYPFQYTTEKVSSEMKSNQSNFDQSNVIKIGHTGSMLPARGVTYWINEKFNRDHNIFFEEVKPLFGTFDFLSATMESSVLGEGQQCDGCMAFIGPEEFIPYIKENGIGFVSMAANHIMDGGVEAVERTQQLLEELGIKTTGASTINNDDAGKPVLIEVNGLKIAYLAFNDTPGRNQWADETNPGAASISDWILDEYGNTVVYEPNEERIKYVIDRAKELNPDLVMVVIHWGGQEYIDAALPYQETLANLLLENGVDIILGDHVHWVQEVQFIDNKPVFYGVGNFVFDQMWSIETRQGITIELNFYDKKLKNFRLHPHELNLYEEGQVNLLEENSPSYIQTLERIWNVSDDLQ